MYKTAEEEAKINLEENIITRVKKEQSFKVVYTDLWY